MKYKLTSKRNLLFLLGVGILFLAGCAHTISAPAGDKAVDDQVPPQDTLNEIVDSPADNGAQVPLPLEPEDDDTTGTGDVFGDTDEDEAEESSGDEAQDTGTTDDDSAALDDTTGQAPPSTREFIIMARRWEFRPSVITVGKGDTVKMSITSIDVRHGIAIPDFDVNENLSPGTTVDIEFVADKAGTFSFFCSVLCGSGHGTMRGQLIVVE